MLCVKSDDVPTAALSPPEELDSDHARKVAELEQAAQNKLKERQKIHEEAFRHDMERYLSTGYLQLHGEPFPTEYPV